MSAQHLGTYLNDHLAGAAAALQMLTDLGASPAEAAWTEPLKAAIAEDRQQLERLMNELSIAQSAARRAVGWIGEHLAALKTRMDDGGDGTLHRFELIEALALGIDGKRALWTALQNAAPADARLQRLDYPQLIARAEEQRRLVELHRLAAAAGALHP